MQQQRLSMLSYSIQERQTKGDRNTVKQSVDLRQLARDALNPIEKKLKGLYSKDSNRNDKRNKEVTTSNLVQMLIEEATDLRNLVRLLLFTLARCDVLI